MAISSSYRAVFTQNPAGITLDFDKLKPDNYRIQGAFSAASWVQMCEKLNFKPSGGCTVELDVAVFKNRVELSGTLDVTVERTCTRTLEPFEARQTLHIAEKLFFPGLAQTEDQDELESRQLHMEEYLYTQLALGLESYPVHPSTLNVPRGAYGVNDGLKQEEIKRENPFAVLEKLKKS